MRNSITLIFAGALLALTGCNSERKMQRHLESYANDLNTAQPVQPDSAGRYKLADGAPETVELAVLDGLLKKYPGKKEFRTVTKIERDTIRVPAKEAIAKVRIVTDTLQNRKLRDSLLSRLLILSREGRADAELRAELAVLKLGLLKVLNNKGCLPDTVIRFSDKGMTLQIKRVPGSDRYKFTLSSDGLALPYQRSRTEEATIHTRPVFTERKYWEFPQFWIATIGDVLLLVALGYTYHARRTA